MPDWAWVATVIIVVGAGTLYFLILMDALYDPEKEEDDQLER